MVDRLKDADDLKLEALFSSEPIDDDGFSERIVKRVRRRMWIRRLSLPVAIATGALVSTKPAVQLATLFASFVTAAPEKLVNMIELPGADLVQGSSIFFGAMLLATIFMVARIIEES